jgi:hypothetical protein
VKACIVVEKCRELLDGKTNIGALGSVLWRTFEEARHYLKNDKEVIAEIEFMNENELRAAIMQSYRPEYRRTEYNIKFLGFFKLA